MGEKGPKEKCELCHSDGLLDMAEAYQLMGFFILHKLSEITDFTEMTASY